jgi:hypothetical protein
MTDRTSDEIGNERPAPVFVAIETSAFSGATLLAFLLGAHPQIATVGEMNGLIARENPDTYLCSCGQNIKACPFWDSVGAAMRRRGLAFDVAHFDTEFDLGGPRPIQYLRRGSFRNNSVDAMRDALFRAWPSERHRLQALAARNMAFIESVLEVTDKRVFVDTSKDRLRLNALRRYTSLDVRAIHLVRDVRGVVASRLRRGASIDAREAAQQWARLHQRLQINLGVLSADRRIRVRYEDLCQDTRGTLQRLYRFCGVDLDVQTADHRSIPQHIVGNAMRLTDLPEIRADERWRSLLTKDQLDEIQRVAGSLIHQYGYF